MHSNDPRDPNKLTERSVHAGSIGQAQVDIANGLDLGGTIYTAGLRDNITSVVIHDGPTTKTNWRAWGLFFLIILGLAAVVGIGYGAVKLFRASMVVEITPQERQSAIAQLTPYADGRVQDPRTLSRDMEELWHDGFRRRNDPQQRMAALAIFALSEPYPENMQKVHYWTLDKIHNRMRREWEGTDVAQAVLEKELENREWLCGGPGC